MSDFSDVGDFHRKFGLPVAGENGDRPTEIPDDVALFRLKFMLEELREVAHGYGYDMSPVITRLPGPFPPRQDLAAIADGLVDLNYVSLGTAHLHLLPWGELWADVQRANMAKERAVNDSDPRSMRRHHMDVVKPAGWKPPSTIEVLMANGWPGPPLPI